MTTILVIKILAIILLLICSAISSGSETALTAISKLRAIKYKDQGNEKAGYILKIKEIKNQFITGVLLANNLFNILATVLFTEILISYFGGFGMTIATIVMTFAIVIFSEVTPKIYAINKPMKFSLAVAKLFFYYTKFISPVVFFINKIASYFMGLLGMKLDENPNKNMEEEFEGAIKYQKQHSKDNIEQIEYMSNLLELKNLKVDELMTHRNDISYIDSSDPIEKIIDYLKVNNFTRVPVIKKNFENVLGILDIRDLLKSEITLNELNQDRIVDHLNDPWFIPENKMAIKQLIDFKSKREHMALIVDEYGAVQGLISFEDIIEEIIGEVFDETDVENSYLEKLDSNNYLFNGNTSIRELNRVLKIVLPDEHVTLSGLVYSITNDIPKVGKVLNYHDIKIQIISKSVNKISKIKITI